MKQKHIIQLDGLRFFAVLMVMIAHWLQLQWKNPVLTNIPFVHGVTLFFVLSGFLITKILLENRDKCIERKISKFQFIKNFCARRFLRIAPIYYLLIFGLFFFDYKNTQQLFPWLITYTTNIYQSINNVYVGDFNHFWSLAVEEQFYLFWPFVIVFITPRKTLIAIILTIIIALLCRTFLYLYVGNWMATSYFTLSCMHALGVGALLGYIKLYKSNIEDRLLNPKWLYISVILYVSSLFFQTIFDLNWYKEIVDDFLFALLAALIILRASKNGFKGFAKVLLENKFIVYSGKISYGLYVFHPFIPKLYESIAPDLGLSIDNKYILFIIFYFLTFLAAHISWKIIEFPINKLKNRVPYIPLAISRTKGQPND